MSAYMAVLPVVESQMRFWQRPYDRWTTRIIEL